MESFPEDKVIEKAAFDEQMIGYGCWLGDEHVDVPSFFVLPYPFIYRGLNVPSLTLPQAHYDESISEYFWIWKVPPLPMRVESSSNSSNPPLIF